MFGSETQEGALRGEVQVTFVLPARSPTRPSQGKSVPRSRGHDSICRKDAQRRVTLYSARSFEACRESEYSHFKNLSSGARAPARGRLASRARGFSRRGAANAQIQLRMHTSLLCLSPGDSAGAINIFDHIFAACRRPEVLVCC